MSVALAEGRIHVRAPSRIEDAESLLALLRDRAGLAVDLTGAGALHTAVVQVLLAFRPTLSGHNDDAFFTAWLHPILTAAVIQPVAETAIVASGHGVAEAIPPVGTGPAVTHNSEQT